MDVHDFPVQGDDDVKDEARTAAQRTLEYALQWPKTIDESLLLSSKQLKVLCRKGIPPHFRERIWMLRSGAEEKMKAAGPSYYENLKHRVTEWLERAPSPRNGVEKNGLEDLVDRGIGENLSNVKIKEAFKSVDGDVPRTFPGHKWIRSDDGMNRLRNVLRCYAIRNANVAYCQSMNFVAALLLIALKGDEEKAFWLLAVLIEETLVPDLYSANLFGCQVEQKVIGHLTRKKYPHLARYLEKIGCDMAFITTDWILCLFSRSLPAETTLRIWDTLFGEGSKIILRVCLAIFKKSAPDIVCCENEGDVMQKLKAIGSKIHNADDLLATAFDGIGPLSKSEVSRLRAKYTLEVKKELAELETRRKTADKVRASASR